MQVFTLYEGSYSVAADKKFIPFDPLKDQFKDRPGSLFIHVQPFLVQFGTQLLVLDTGLGYSKKSGQMILHECIKNAGFDPADVDYILMSHLHFDHAGGMVHQTSSGMELSFPNATYVINRGEWEAAFTNSSSSYRTDIFDFVQRNATILFVEESGEVIPGISYFQTGGHTPFHQAFLLEDGTDKVFFGGDVLPEPEELIKKFIAKYDYDGRRSMELRAEFGRSAAENNWLCLYYHGKSKASSFVRLDENENFMIV